MHTSTRIILIIVFCLLTEISSVQGQETGTIQATATVLSALTVTGTNDLQFGNVTPGTPKTVDKADVGTGGEWTISGQASAEINLDFTLPDSLRTTGGAAMDISFLVNDASFDDGTGGGQTAPSGTLNPLATNTENIGAGGAMTVWIGGQVTPILAQTGGTYSGTVELTITLTGN